MEELKPCPFCGGEWPLEYISLFTVVLRCDCGATVKSNAATVLYQWDEVPTHLMKHTYNADALIIRRDNIDVSFPDHGYVGVSAIEALRDAGALEAWNRRV